MLWKEIKTNFSLLGISVGLKTRIHDEAFIGLGCEIDGSVKIEERASVNPCQIGSHSRIRYGATVSTRCWIGENVEIGSYAIIGPRTTIEDGCRIGKNVIIGSDCIIKSNARIKAGARICQKTIIGSGEIVKESR